MHKDLIDKVFWHEQTFLNLLVNKSSNILNAFKGSLYAHAHTHTHTHVHAYMCMHVCVCMCVSLCA